MPTLSRPSHVRGGSRARALAVVPVLAAIALVLGGCAAGEPSPVPTQPPPATPVPDQPVSSGGSMLLPPGGGAPGDPGAGDAQLVSPVAGAVQLREVAADALSVGVNGRQVGARVEWWSGVEPCAVLAGVELAREGTAFTVTLHEGTLDPAAACIEIAVRKATIVDLGELGPGDYTVRATGSAPEVAFTVT